MSERPPLPSSYIQMHLPDPLEELYAMGIKRIRLDDPIPYDIENVKGRSIELSSEEFVNILPDIDYYRQRFGWWQLYRAIKEQLIRNLAQALWVRQRDDQVSPQQKIDAGDIAVRYVLSPGEKLAYSTCQALTLRLQHKVKKPNSAIDYAFPFAKYIDDRLSPEQYQQLKESGKITLVGAFAPVELEGMWGLGSIWMRKRVIDSRDPNKTWYSIPGGKADLRDVKTGEITAIRELREETGLTWRQLQYIRMLGCVDQYMLDSNGQPVRYIGYIMDGILFLHKEYELEEWKSMSAEKRRKTTERDFKRYRKAPKPRNNDGKGDWGLVSGFTHERRGLGLLGNTDIPFSPLVRLFLDKYRTKPHT